MSRTIRRTKTTKLRSRFAKDYAEYKWKFHADSGCPGFGFEKAFEHPCVESNKEGRCRYKREIIKWMKDEEYEIILNKPRHFWEYC